MRPIALRPIHIILFLMLLMVMLTVIGGLRIADLGPDKERGTICADEWYELEMNSDQTFTIRTSNSTIEGVVAVRYYTNGTIEYTIEDDHEGMIAFFTFLIVISCIIFLVLLAILIALSKELLSPRYLIGEMTEERFRKWASRILYDCMKSIKTRKKQKKFLKAILRCLEDGNCITLVIRRYDVTTKYINTNVWDVCAVYYNVEPGAEDVLKSVVFAYNDAHKLGLEDLIKER